MSNSDDDCDVGMGDMFGAPEEEVVKPDIEFQVDRSAWMQEGTTAPSFTPLWPKTAVTAGSPSIELRRLTLFQKDKHHSLWGHRIWNAAKFISKRIDQGLIHVEGQSVLELGSGVGVPSLVAHQCKARLVVVTDYPDDDLISILEKNVAANRMETEPEQADDSAGPQIRFGQLHAIPLLWGKEEHIRRALELTGGCGGFDVVILSDIVFNHVCHDELLRTVATCLSKDRRAAAYCAFSHHRVHKVQDDMNFFEKLPRFGLEFEKIDEEHYPLMFPDDPGPVEIRMPVHCYRIRHRYDAAGPPVDMLTSPDVVVQGTGVSETILSAALSRQGLKVLHLDPNPNYGGAFNTLHPEAFTTFIKSSFSDVTIHKDQFQQDSELQGIQRRFQLDTIPMTFLSGGALVKKLVDSETARNMEFQTVDRIALLSMQRISGTTEGGGNFKLEKMPLSRSDVFSSANFSPMEMRRLMKFVKDVEAQLVEHFHTTTSPGAPSTATKWSDGDMKAGETFPEFLQRKYQLSQKSVHLLTLFGLLQDSSSRWEASIQLLRTFLTSVGLYDGPTPYLLPSYGCAELPQNMCRVSAVWDGTFILRRGIQATWRDDKKAFVELSNLQRLETKAVVVGSMGAATELLRAVVVRRTPLVSWACIESQLGDMPADEREMRMRESSAPLLVLAGGFCLTDTRSVIAAAAGDAGYVFPVHVVQQTAATMQTPADSQAVVLHFTMTRERGSAEGPDVSHLDDYVTAVLNSFDPHGETQQDDDVWYRCSYVVSNANQSVPDVRMSESGICARGEDPETEAATHVPDHVFTVQSLFDVMHESQYLVEAERCFHQVVRHCKDMGIDPWSRCVHPDRVSNGAAEGAAAEDTAECVTFLPPPPDEIRLQMDGVTVQDADADVLRAATAALPSASPVGDAQATLDDVGDEG